jgi:hypothetical protein
MRATTLALFALLFVATVFAHGGDKSRFERSKNNSPRRVSTGDVKASFMLPYVHNDERACNERCYTMHFNATISNPAATNTDWCDSAGLCPVSIFIRTSPCRRCNAEGEEYTLYEETMGNGNTTNTTYSLSTSCMFSDFSVLLGPGAKNESEVYGEEDCEDIERAMFYKYAFNTEYEVMAARTCSFCKGTVSKWVFNQFDHAPNWPNENRWARHFTPEFTTADDEDEVSDFKAYGPASCNTAPWLTYEFAAQPTEINCGDLNAAYKKAIASANA